MTLEISTLYGDVYLFSLLSFIVHSGIDLNENFQFAFTFFLFLPFFPLLRIDTKILKVEFTC